MRKLFIASLLGLAVGACQCGPDDPTAVTFRIRNPLVTPIYVEAGDGRMGMTVLRRVGGQWHPFVEEPACPCQACDLVCGGCECRPDDAAMVMQIAAGGVFERQWAGRVQVQGTGGCSGPLMQGPSCLEAKNPPVDETFMLQLCYSPSATGAEHVDAGVPVAGSMPEQSTLCLQRPFQVRDQVVEVSPERGSDCASHQECKGSEELCFHGGCTRACPQTGYPELGGSWQVRIPEPDDQGFFSQSVREQVRVSTGRGTVGSVRYENDTLTLLLRRALPGGGTVVASVYATLPSTVAPPFRLGETVEVTVMDASSTSNPDNRGLVVRDQEGTLLLAAETAQQGLLLSAPSIAPYAVARVGPPVGCRHTPCGKRLHHLTRFELGDQAVELEPGKVADLVAGGQTWRLVNVGNARYPSTHCALDEVMPWAVSNLRSP